MKTLNGLICLSVIFLISGCMPDSFTNWNLEPPSSGSSSDGATDGGNTPGGPNPPPPTSFVYNPNGPYSYNLSSDASATISDLSPISTGGGEITPGYITFQLVGVTDINGIATTTVWPNSLTMNPSTGVISGRPNQFINHNIYRVRATPLGQAPIYTNIEISMATKPDIIYFPQPNGQTLLLEVSKPENFKVGNWVTSEKNAKGTVTSVDQTNKNIYITVSCTPSVSQPICPIFQNGDKIDNKNGYFLEQSIVSKVVYGFTKTTGIPTMIPITDPNLNAEKPQYAISPDITIYNGVNFSSSTGQIFAAPNINLPDIPNTEFTVTVKNVIGETANAIFNLQLLDVSNPRSPDSVEYAYSSGNRVVLNIDNTNSFLVDGRISNQRGASGTIKSKTTALDSGPNAPGIFVIDIDPASKSNFKKGDPVDNGYPFVLAVTTLSPSIEPFRVHQLGTPFSASATLTGNLSASDLNTLTWTSTPELPHLCNSIASTPTVYYAEETSTACTNAHGTCSNSSITNGAACIFPAVWTTSAKFETAYKDELWFNRKTGKFGADNPKKPFSPQTFEVKVTSLTGVTLTTNTAFSFQDVPKNLGYASDVLLEVDNFSDFDINDLITTDGTGVGLITYKFTNGTSNILVVKTTAGEFLDGEDIDNVYPFTFQKGEIKKAKYNNLGIQVASVAGFATDTQVSITTPPVKGIINFIDPGLGVLWVRLIETTSTSLPPASFTTAGNPTITSSTGANSIITGIIADNVIINQNGATTFTAGMDVSSNAGPPLGGFGMVNSVNGFNLLVSVQQGRFVKGASLFRLNPITTGASGQASSIINDITHSPVFFLDRFGTSGIQEVINSPANNGVTYSITPALPKGLVLDPNTGEITTEDPGPVAAALKNYTIVASNYLGQTSFTFGLAVREVFSVTDITNGTGNLTGILHKSGQGYSRFPCRVTQDQIKMTDPNFAPRAKNINCLYDVGEGELFENGLEIKVNVGSDLCTYIEHLPYFFYQQQYVQTDPATATPSMQHTGDWSDVACGPGQPNGIPVQYPGELPAQKCLGNQQGVQCDDGAVPTIERNYTLVGACYNPSTSTGATTLASCFGDAALPGNTPANSAFCSNGSNDTRTVCLNKNLAWNTRNVFNNNQCFVINTTFTDAVSCSDNIGACTGGVGANRNDCTAAGGTWNPTGRWVERAVCRSTPGAAGQNYECGGSQINCINGPGKDFIPEGKLTNRFGTFIRGPVTRVEDDPISFTYKSPDSFDYSTNLYLTNFSRTNACTPFNLNPYEYDMNTWFNVGRLQNPSSPTQGANAPFAGGNGVYAIRCLDGAANIIAQINILIREWDFDFKAKDGTDLMDLSGTPLDGTGTNEFGYPINAYDDWDNRPAAPTSCSVPKYFYPQNNL